MTRNLKGLGLALIAVCAMGAVMASAAQAEATFTGYEGTPPNQTYVHTLISGSQIGTNVFEITAGSLELKCTTASFTGTSVAGDDATLTIIPSYSNCHALAAVFTAHVNMNGCDYLYHITKKETEHKYSGHIDLVCPAGKSVHIETTKLAGGTKCTITETGQNNLGAVYYTNITPETEAEETTKIAMGEPKKPKDVVLDANVNNIASTTSAPSGKPSDCGVAKLGAHVGGTYVGETTLIGRNTANEQINLTVSGENP